MLPGARLRLLREHRAIGGGVPSIGDQVARERDRLERAAREEGGIGGVWARGVPDALRGGAAVVGVKGGVLTVRCRSASDRFALDRWLRSGGERALCEAARSARVALSRVRLVLR